MRDCDINNICKDDIPSFEGSKIPLATISKVEKVGGKGAKERHILDIYSKDVRLVRFGFLKHEDRSKFYHTLKDDYPVSNFYCNYYKIPITATTLDGWKVYDPRSEFARQQLFASKDADVYAESQSKGWRLTKVNNEYKLCDTYPKEFVIPSSLSDDDIKACAEFRSKKRLPVLSFYCPKTQASLTRSSQPLIGLIVNTKSKKFQDDHKMIDCILAANPNCDTLKIVDLRPRLNANANRLKGAGYELDTSYKNITIAFMDIENIHVMRSSFNKLAELCLATGGIDANWLTKVEACGWLDHVRLVLHASKYCVDCLLELKMSVLLHCSDGWDRTSQCVCISQVMMDPYYRTMNGFAILVEKEWLSYGHKFNQRIGHGSRNANHEERGPIFLQFLDAMYQMLRQHPTAFEFNENFLISLMDYCYSCRFGTFLYDSPRERETQKIFENTSSVWTYMLNSPYREHFMNPFFAPEQTSDVIYPDTKQASLALWSGYFLRFAKDQKFDQPPTPPNSKEPTGPMIKFERPELVINDRGISLLEYIQKMEVKNEATVSTFQRELKSMWIQIDDLKAKNNDWKMRYETDITQLLELCEQQREELSKWTNEPTNTTAKIHLFSNPVSLDGLSDKKEIGTSNSNKELEEMKKERDEWKQKALHLQVEVLAKKESK